jgi:two-component system KDP operon response regulator KdpE
VADGAGAPVILLVEDEAPNRALLKAVLSRSRNESIRGARIVEATTLAEARACLTGEPFDIILLDVRLPDGSGLDLARELRDRPAGRRPRVLVLSASVLPMERTAAVEAGADAFLPKPYDTAQLIDLLASLVDEGPRHTG